MVLLSSQERRIRCPSSAWTFWARTAERTFRVLLPHSERARAMSTKSTTQYRNRLLSALAADDLATLRPHLQSVSLERGKTLERPNKRIEFVYFPETATASVIGGA